MSLHHEEVQEMSSGFAKTIEASAQGLIMENLQRYQYQYPIKSTIREIVCNGIDSIADRNAAIDIILHNAPISKYFDEDKESPLFKDSKFNPNYYTPQWLSTDERVYVTYKEGQQQEKDCIIITDHGTGLGGKRLEGYFNLGFSTKRLSKLPLGKFGIGAKSALSVGVQFYTVESRYNGMKFRFNIYSSRVDSIIPQWDLTKNEENPHVLFGDPGAEFKVYYEPTKELNGVTVTIEAKKHHKQQYIDAVKSQLLYFQNVEFMVDHGHSLEAIPYKASILYEDEYIVLSDNKMWSKPHLLLNKVNYGYINWEELELEPKVGNIGIKVRPEDVEVNPSRESVIWSEETKEMVHKRFRNVVDIATTFVQKELNSIDIITWLRVCYQISANSWNDSSIVARLASIIDITQIQPHFPPDSSIKFASSNFFQCFSCRKFSEEQKSKANKQLKKVVREELHSEIFRFNHLPFVILDTNVSVRKDKYLLKSIYPNGFIGIKAPEWIEETFDPTVILSIETLSQMSLGYSEFAIAQLSKKSLEALKQQVRVANSVWAWLQKSTEVITYSTVEVPEDFKCSDDDEEEEIVTEEDALVAKESQILAAERRKVEGKTIVHTPRFKFWHQSLNTYTEFYSFDKKEIKVSEISAWDNKEIYYATGTTGVDDMGNITTPELEMMEMAAFITRIPGKELNTGSGLNHHWNYPKLRLIKVAQANVRMYRDFKPIMQFYLDVKNKCISMSNALLRWNTARLMGKKLNQAAFLWNFELFDIDRTKAFMGLVQYVQRNYNEVGKYAVSGYGITAPAYQSIVAHLDKVQEFQLYLNSNPPSEDVAKVSQELFGASQYTAAMAVDPEVWSVFQDLMEYAEPIGTFLNEMPVLTGLDVIDVETEVPNGPIVYDQFAERVKRTPCEEVEREIRGFLQWKGVS